MRYGNQNSAQWGVDDLRQIIILTSVVGDYSVPAQSCEGDLKPKFFNPVHRAGWPFLIGFGALTIVFWWMWQPLGFLGCLLTLWCAYFFRDPDRITPIQPGLVISPADGIVQMIQPAVPPSELGLDQRPRTRISIFMDVLSVHINRSPVDGEVVATSYRPGKFLMLLWIKPVMRMSVVRCTCAL